MYGVAQMRKLKHMGRGTVRAARRFGRDEDGTLVIFALVLFVLMTMMGGLAIDLMKYEQTRTTLQNTLDRSTLAAASLTQTLDPEEVVNRLLRQGRDVRIPDRCVGQ